MHLPVAYHILRSVQNFVSHFGQMFALYVGEVVSGYQRMKKKKVYSHALGVWDDDNQILQQRMISILPEHFPLVCGWLGMRGMLN